MTSTILVAEDEDAARTSLVALLEAEGFSVLAARDGAEALSITLHEEPDAVLLDIRMPGLDGLSVYGKRFQAVPIPRSLL